MAASMYDQMMNPHKTFLGQLLAFNEMAMRIYGEAGKEQIKVMNELLLCHAKQIQDLSHAKKLDQMMDVYAQGLSNVATPLNDYAQYMIDAVLECNANYSKWLENNYQQHSQILKETVKDAKEEIKESIKEGKHFQEKAVGRK